MKFIDHTGHIFSIDDYTSYPVGYEYDECPYTFWMQDEYSSELSIDCFYIKPIRLILEGNVEFVDIEIKNSNNFRLLSSSKIQQLVNENVNPLDYIQLNYATTEALNYWGDENNPEYKNDFVNKLKYKHGANDNDILVIPNLHCDYFYYIDKTTNKKIYIENESDIIVHKDLSYQNLDIDLKLSIILPENPDFKFSSDDLLDIEKHKELNLALAEIGYNESYEYINSNNEKVEAIKTKTIYSLVPFYVIGSTSEYGSWSTNVLIHAKSSNSDETWCPITVGGTFTNEIEELEINAKNIGLSLPKDICRALYNSSFWNESPDLSLWNQKIKEYLLNYMKLNGERGNFQSSIAALKWFGYGDRIKLYSLIQTDNEFIEQYILNNFDIQYDVINEFRYFRNSTLMSLEIPGVVEDTENTHNFHFDEDFWGEGKPYTKDLFDETISVKYDEGDIEFIRPLYDWAFNELALKLCALKYYYQKYFLPIHLYIHRASITNQCFASDVKLLSAARTLITEKYVYSNPGDTTVEFPKSKKVWLTDQCRLVDSNWIEDPQLQIPLRENGLIDSINMSFYEIIDNCFNVKIKLINKNYSEENKEKVFNCSLFAYQDNKIMKTSIFSVCSDEKEYVINFVIYPKVLNSNYDINFWLSRKYSIKMICNGQWYDYNFSIAIPELDIEIGKLIYKYDSDVCRQFSGFDNNKPKFNISMYLPELVTINNINFIGDLCEYAKNENIHHISNKAFDEDICCDKVYYYYFNEDGQKEILSSGEHTLVYDVASNEYLIRKNKYSDIGLRIQKINNGPIYSSIYKNINSFINLYNVQTNVPTNYNFLNKVHIFKLHKIEGNNKYSQIPYVAEESGKIIERPETYRKDNNDKYYNLSTLNDLGEITYDKYKFSDNDSVFIRNLYLEFFTEDGYWKTDNLKYWDTNDNSWKQTVLEQTNYDLYIMHDFDYWYAIMISKLPIAQTSVDLSKVNSIYKCGERYALEYMRSDDKFLVNRMEFGQMNNVYHFNPKDMIVAKLNNFDTLAFKLKVGSRWNFYPLGVGSSIKQSFESPTNIGLMSIRQSDLQHANGYYSVQVNYSIDNFVNNSQERKTRILISDKIQSPTPIIIDKQ